MTSRPIFYIIDGHALAYRQFFGLPIQAFSTADGEPTNATYGFTRILMDLILNVKPDYLAVSFDMGLSGRDVIFGEYKGTREKMPDDLERQMPRIEEIVRAFNIPILSFDDYEADDVIGTAARQAEAAGVDVRIITGDRDLLQLLTDHVTVQLPSRGDGPDDVYDIARFKERYTLEPQRLVDMKALMGDTSDNIPGIAGIGEKTATKLLLQYDTLDGIYENIHEITGSLKNKLDSGKDLAYISYELASIQFDVPIQIDLEACVAHDFNPETVISLFQGLEFRSFTQRLLERQSEQEIVPVDENFAPPSPDGGLKTVVVQDEAQLNKLVDILNNATEIVWDVESTSIDQMEAELVGIALSTDGETGYYIPVGHVAQGAGTLFEEPSEKQLPLETVIEALRKPLTNPDIPKYAHNAAYDLVVTERHGIPVEPVRFDTMIAEWLLDPTSRFLGLKNFAAQYLNVYMTPITDLIGTGKKQKMISEVAIAEVAPYAAADAVVTFRAVEHLRPKLEESQLLDLYEQLELPLISVITSMEQAGVALDVPHLREMSERLDEQLHTIEQHVYNLSDGYGEFNINSPKQLNEVLFDKLNLPVQGLKRTSHGYSTDAVTLQRLQEETKHPIVESIIEYREISKLKSTYIDALPELINPHTGRLHTSYNQTGTTTGRISSSNPNLQNIPIRSELGREVRRAFIAPEGRSLLAVDYSQIELRVLAHVTGEETLVEAFAQDQDIHAATASAVFGIPIEDVTYDQRDFAKRVNFGILYGMGPYRLARDSDLTLAEATDFIERYFERLPKVNKYIETTRHRVTQTGYVETLLGRRRYFNALQSTRTSRNIVEAELRAAVNMPIQGTAADIMKQSMIDLHAALQKEKCDALMILQVHDELVLEVPESEVEHICDLVIHVMQSAYKLDVPLKANAQFGQNWRDMEKL